MTPPDAVEIPQSFLEVLANEKTRHVLLKIAYDGPTRWSAVRDDLAMHPQEYQRALDKLHDHALIRSRALAKDPRDARTSRRQVVQLEVTKLGGLVVDLWEDMNRDARRLARKANIDLGALAAE